MHGTNNTISVAVATAAARVRELIRGRNHIPHASQELDEAAISKGQAGDDVGLGHTASLEVDEGQNEGRQGEGGKTERCRVGKLAVRDGLVQAGLEFTTECRETAFGVLVRLRLVERVAAVIQAVDSLCAVGSSTGRGADILLDANRRDSLGGCHWGGVG